MVRKHEKIIRISEKYQLKCIEKELVQQALVEESERSNDCDGVELYCCDRRVDDHAIVNRLPNAIEFFRQY